MLTYSCGLRVSEVAMMQVKDIDSERMVVVVHQGKGRKDRITLLSEKMLDQLRIYYKTYRPKVWLFENPLKDGPISGRTLQQVFRNSATDLRFIQELLGHSSSKTTEIYTHVSRASLSRITNPLDQL
ncbi:MAG: hypothetical protein CVU98_11310 [Firmicutes bacterium HGW-Firmicutes-3]|nr:MAG: hypothetical protein CVU98_11310 [Firmicutes bacterium HGW-Firmicutes-3]